MSKINTFPMRILTKPFEGTVFSRDNIPEVRKMNPYVTGDGALSYNCGSCSHPLLRSINRGQVTQVIYKCPKCGSYNQIDAAEKKH